MTRDFFATRACKGQLVTARDVVGEAGPTHAIVVREVAQRYRFFLNGGDSDKSAMAKAVASGLAKRWGRRTTPTAEQLAEIERLARSAA